MFDQGGHQMIEATTSAQTRAGFAAAHEARGEALKSVLRWLFRSEDAPLAADCLTEPCR